MTTRSSIRLLIAGAPAGATDWDDWRAAQKESAYAARIAVQRLSRPARGGLERAVGLGYRESLRWFRPLDDPKLRRVLLDYAGAVLEADRFPEVPEVLRTFLIPHQNELAEQTPSAAEGVVFLTHAETDLLALARSDLAPADFRV